MAKILELLETYEGLPTSEIIDWMRPKLRPHIVRTDLDRLWCEGRVTKRRCHKVFPRKDLYELNLSGFGWYWEPVRGRPAKS